MRKNNFKKGKKSLKSGLKMCLERFNKKKILTLGLGWAWASALQKIGVFSLEVTLLTWLIKHLCKMDITSYFADFQDGKITKIAIKRDQKLYLRYEFPKFSCAGPLAPFLLFSCNRQVIKMQREWSWQMYRVVIIYLKIPKNAPILIILSTI